MAGAVKFPTRLCDIVQDLPEETRVFLYMEDRRDKMREVLLDEDTQADKRKVLAKFANAVVGAVVKAGSSLRIIYLDRKQTESYSKRLSELQTGEQLQLHF